MHESPNKHWPFGVRRMQSPFSDLFSAFSLPFPFASPLLDALLAGLSSSRFSPCEMRIFDFLLEMSFDNQSQSEIIIFLVTKRSLLSVDLQKVFQIFRLFNLHLVQTLQYAISGSVSDCWWYFVPLSVAGLNVVVLQLNF